MSEKLCVFCKHFDWEAIDYVNYGTMTGGNMEGGMTCKQGVYWGEKPDDTKDFRQLILTAETCGQYEPDTGENP